MPRKTLIIIISVALIFATGILVLFHLPENDAQPESTARPPVIREIGTLIRASHTDVDSVEIKLPGRPSYTLRLDHSDPDDYKIELISDDALFPGMEPVMFAIFSHAISVMHLTRVTEDATDEQLELYGLAEPLIEWRVNFLDGNFFEFAIGYRLAAGSGNYVRDKDSRDVYILDETAVNFLSFDINDIYDIFFFPYPPSDEEFRTWQFIQHVLLERPGNDTIEIKKRTEEEWFESAYGVSRFKLLQPVVDECNDILVESVLMEVITHIIPERIISIRPVDLSPYGLDDPFRLTVSTESWTGTVLIGNSSRDYRGRYVMLEGHDAVLLDPHGDYSFLGLEYSQIRTQLTWLNIIDNVSSLVFDLGGVSRSLLINHPASEDDELSGSLDGAVLSERNTRRLYASAMSIPVSGSFEGLVPDVSPVYTFTMFFINGGSQSLEFYPITDSQFLMVLDGTSLGVYTTRLQIQLNLLDRFDTLDAGGDLAR